MSKRARGQESKKASRAGYARASLLLSCSLILLLSCPAPKAPPADRDGAGTELGETCAALRRAGCPEGEPLTDGQTCFEHLTEMSARVAIPTACVRGAVDARAVRTCGSPGDLRFRCPNP